MSTEEIKTSDPDRVKQQQAEKHRTPYFNWVRHLLTIATTSLTALIALQSQYIPLNPVSLWSLKGAWYCLLAAIALGIYASKEEWNGHWRIAKRIEDDQLLYGKEFVDQNFSVETALREPPPLPHSISVAALQLLIVSALALLCIFASENLERIESQKSHPATSATAVPAR